MVRRWTYTYAKMNTNESSRRDHIKRTSSGFRHYLMMPLVPFLIYWGAAWLGALVMSGASAFVRAIVPRRKSA